MGGRFFHAIHQPWYAKHAAASSAGGHVAASNPSHTT